MIDNRGSIVEQDRQSLALTNHAIRPAQPAAIRVATLDQSKCVELAQTIPIPALASYGVG